MDPSLETTGTVHASKWIFDEIATSLVDLQELSNVNGSFAQNQIILHSKIIVSSLFYVDSRLRFYRICVFCFICV